MTISQGGRWACTCADWKFHGGNLYDQRLQNKVALALEVQLSEPQADPESGLITWDATSDDVMEYTVVIGVEGTTKTMCKHVLAALWSLGLTPALVEYENGDREIRTEAYWADPVVTESFEDMTQITLLERSNNK